LERAGELFGTERFGDHEWYPEGALVILDAQEADGSWFRDGHGSHVSGRESDTCWAILFLKRATRPLTDIVSEDTRFAKKKNEAADPDAPVIVVPDREK
jgi:hypothetical protein